MRRIATVVIEVYGQDPPPNIDHGKKRLTQDDLKAAAKITKAQQALDEKEREALGAALPKLTSQVRNLFPNARIKAVDCWTSRRSL